jgi:dUTP pyrophosphatase
MQIKLTNLAKELMANGIKDPANPEQYASFVPFQGTPASAGFDLRACIDEPKEIPFGETLLVPCGFHLHIKDPNIVGLLYIRSSIGTKLGLTLANSVGVIDSDYQDEWMLAIKNTHECVRTIYPAQRLAQVVFTPIVHPIFYHVEEFTESSDRFGGFGSTDSAKITGHKLQLPNDGKTYGG